jgi:hypothetical protein
VRLLAGAYAGEMRRSPKSRRRRFLIIVGALVLEPVAMWLRGYPVAGNLVVRCRQDHLFTTIWLPGVSLKSIRLIWWRVQWCPVGKHLSIVTPVKKTELSDEQKRVATGNRDLRIP